MIPVVLHVLLNFITNIKSRADISPPTYDIYIKAFVEYMTVLFMDREETMTFKHAHLIILVNW